MKDMGAPVRRWAERRSKACQALTTKMGVQQRKKRKTMTRSMRITRFLAIRLDVELLLHTRPTMGLLVLLLELGTLPVLIVMLFFLDGCM